MSWSGNNDIFKCWFCLLSRLEESLILCHWKAIKWFIHGLLWIRVVITRSWVFVPFYEWWTLHILSTYRKWKSFALFVLFLCIMVKIIDQCWCISGGRWYVSFNIKNNCFLSNTKTWGFFTIGRRHIIKMVWFIWLCFHFGLSVWIKSLCFAKWELEFWCGVI